MKHKTDMEKPSKYFLSTEKQQHKNNLIKDLSNIEGKVVNEPSQMVEHVRNFYKNLFSSDKINNFHLQKIIDTVSTYHFENDVIQEMEKDINENELYQSLKDMAKDKAPGLDGLTVEFYSTFWYLIKNDFTELVNYCYKRGRLPDSMNKALIRLIFKNRGKRSDLKNWRPILLVYLTLITKLCINSLLNVYEN